MTTRRIHRLASHAKGRYTLRLNLHPTATTRTINREKTMSEPEAATTTPAKPTVSSILKELTQPFVDVVRAPRALWGVNVSYLLEGLTYFGVLSLLALFF